MTQRRNVAPIFSRRALAPGLRVIGGNRGLAPAG